MNEDALEALLVGTARAVSRARAATAATFRRRGSAWDAPLGIRCGRCGLRILGRAGVVGRAELHESVCPGGNRAGEVWWPLIHRADVAPWRSGPALRLVRGGRSR